MDTEIRLAAFDWLSKAKSIYGELLTPQIIDAGFKFQGERFTVKGPKGIWKPKQMDLPISIFTSFNSPYDDGEHEKSFLYKYRGNNPNHQDNVGLRYCMQNQIPLIYIIAVAEKPTFYSVIYPVYIVHDNPATLTFTILAGENLLLTEETEFTEPEEKELVRSYITVQTKRRVHQQKFSRQVLNAYGVKCALCNLKHQELLDAAHIIPDKDEKGEPVIPNGISLCKIHHAAFDQNIIGIDPNYQIHVRQDVLEEVDGPMLKYGIQSLNNQNMILPKKRNHYPDKERLDLRYTQFRNA